MVRRKIMGLFVCTLVLGMATMASAFVPDLALSTAETAYHTGGGTGYLAVFNLPNGSGEPLTNAFLPGGSTPEDGTITLILLDAGGNPIPLYPFEDMWLMSGGMTVCQGGSTADFATNDSGITVWANPLNAGAYSGEYDYVAGTIDSAFLTKVVISGDPLTSSTGMLILFNSSDISGDFVVDLIDVGFFAQDMAVYNFRSDLVFDGVIDLPDLGRLAQGIGTTCP